MQAGRVLGVGDTLDPKRQLVQEYHSGWVFVAAGQTGFQLGTLSAPAPGDDLSGVLVIPGTVSPGAITVTDGSTDLAVFPGGTNSVADLKPFFIPLNLKGREGPWKITTGANVTAVAVGPLGTPVSPHGLLLLLA